MSGQYNDVRGDFLYKLPRDQRTPANADRHFVVIFSPQPADSALFILFFITLGCKRYRISLLMRILSVKRMSTPAHAIPPAPVTPMCVFGEVKTRANPYHNQNGCIRKILTLDDRVDVLKRIDNGESCRSI